MSKSLKYNSKVGYAAKSGVSVGQQSMNMFNCNSTDVRTKTNTSGAVVKTVDFNSQMLRRPHLAGAMSSPDFQTTLSTNKLISAADRVAMQKLTPIP